MNNLKKYMLTLALLVPANSAFAAWNDYIPTWEKIKGSAKTAGNYAYSNAIKGANATAQAGKASFDYVKGLNKSTKVVLALGTLGTTGFAAAYKYNKNFKDAVNNKAAQAKNFTKDKLNSLKAKYNSLKDSYSKMDKAKKAKYTKIAAVTGITGAGIVLGCKALPKIMISRGLTKALKDGTLFQ